MKRLISALIITSVVVFFTQHASAGLIRKIYLSVIGGEGKIQRVNLDGSEMEDVVTGLGEPRWMALSVFLGKMYWTDRGTGKIQRANLDGSNVEDLITGLNDPGAIALDIFTGKMYWADHYGTNRRVRRANLDGTDIEDLSAGINAWYNFALDIPGGKIYWADSPINNYIIHRANLDGSDIEDIVEVDWWGWLISSIALDIDSGKMYWTEWSDSPYGNVRRADLDGNNIETLVEGSGAWGIGLDLSSGKMYWIAGSTIQRANLDGSNVEYFSISSNCYSIALAIEMEVGDLCVTPLDGLKSQGYGGGPFTPLSISYTLRNAGPNSIDWTASVTQSWLDVSLSSGTLGPNDVNTVQISINSDANELNYGAYNDTLTITDLTNGNTYVRDIDLAVLIPNKIYWIDEQTDKIQCADLLGQNVEDLITIDLRYFANIDIDYYNSKIYWTNGYGNINRVNLDGTNIEELIAGAYHPRGIAVDALEGKMFWTDYDNHNYRIMWANLDGTNIETLFESYDWLGDIALDTFTGKMYWNDAHKIFRANIEVITNCFITTGMTNFPSGAAPRSASVWIKWGGQTLNYQVIFGYGDDAEGFKVFGAFLDKQNPANLYCWNSYRDGATYNYDTGIDITIGQWTHLVMTYDGTNIKAYPDAVLTDTTERTLDTVLEKSLIGGNTWANCDYFKGSIDNMMIFDKELSQEEIELLYNFGDGTEIIPDGNGFDLLSHCVGHWKMNDNELNTTVEDSSGSGNDGTAKRNTSVLHTESGDPPYLNGALNFTVGNIETLVTGLSNAERIDLDSVSGKMYWTDRGTKKIQRANLDGSNVEDLITGLNYPYGISLHIFAGKMYWTDRDAGKIQRVNLDGSNAENLVTNLGMPSGIAIQNLIDDLAVRPFDGLESEGYEAGPFTPESISYTLKNIRPNTVDWTASVTQSWLDVSVTSGTLEPKDVNTIQISINSDASLLDEGTYNDTLTITNLTSSIEYRRSIKLTIIAYSIADLNKDRFVDFEDFAILASQWLQAPGIPSADIAPPGGDGIVDYDDLAIICQAWLD